MTSVDAIVMERYIKTERLEKLNFTTDGTVIAAIS